MPAPLVPISPTISPAPTSIETWSTAAMPPKFTLTSRPQRGRRRPAIGVARWTVSERHLATLRSARRGPQPALGHAKQRRRGRVPDLHEAAGEVEQQDQQADARGQQRHQVVAGEERGQPDDPHRAEDGPDHRAQAADDDDRHEQRASRRPGSSRCSGTRLQRRRRAARRRGRRCRRRARRRGASRRGARPCRPAAASGLSRTPIVVRPTPGRAGAGRRRRSTTASTAEARRSSRCAASLQVEAEEVGARERHRVVWPPVRIGRR